MNEIFENVIIDTTCRKQDDIIMLDQNSYMAIMFENKCNPHFIFQENCFKITDKRLLTYGCYIYLLKFSMN